MSQKSKRRSPSPPPSPASKKQKQFKRFGFAIIGLGRIGKIHLRNAFSEPSISVKYVVDVDVDMVKESFPHLEIPITGDLDKVLADKDVDAVIICTPTPSHKELILKSVRAKKSVLCEKPVAMKVEEIDECYEAAKKNGVPLLCAFHRRYDPTFSKLQAQCAKGDIGKLQIVKTVSRDNPVPSIKYLSTSGTIFHDCASHDLDLQRWITGEEPTEVYVAASAFNDEIRGINDWDTALITLKYKSGIVGSIDLSRKAVYGYDQRIEVLGDAGMLKAENIQQTGVVHATIDGLKGDPFHYSFPQRYDVTYINELKHFLDVLEGKKELAVTHKDARNNAILANGCEESARTGKPIHLKY